ncbi:MAG: rhodanese-like domain-containing protein [Cyclobacteriaceae bacterium]
MTLQLSLVLFFFSMKGLAQSAVPLIEADVLEKLLQEDSSVVVLDTRSSEEYQAGHLENARFVNYATFQLSDVHDLAKESPIVVYCLSGGRSGRVAQQLLNAGYKNVKNLNGGVRSWQAAGKEVKRE